MSVLKIAQLEADLASNTASSAAIGKWNQAVVAGGAGKQAMRNPNPHTSAENVYFSLITTQT